MNQPKLFKGKVPENFIVDRDREILLIVDENSNSVTIGFGGIQEENIGGRVIQDIVLMAIPLEDAQSDLVPALGRRKVHKVKFKEKVFELPISLTDKTRILPAKREKNKPTETE